jgi:hypothetical protein
MTATPPEPWVPTSKEDWAEAFALGIQKDRAAREEADAKAKAAADAAKGAGGGAAGGSGDSAPKSWRERLLG